MNTQEYRAPSSGYYTVRSSMTRYEGTGVFEDVTNESRWFFQFWKPKTVRREILKRIEELSGNETVYLNKGDVVTTPILRRIYS